jgi:hypothetical protein
VIDALREPTVGNMPPVIRFEPSGAPAIGPRGGSAATPLRTVFPNPAAVNIWVTDDGRKSPQRENVNVSLSWTTFRGRGTVTFAPAKPIIDATGKATVTARFSEPGEYVLRVEAIDMPSHDFQCCWSNGYVPVTVAPSGR